MEAESIDEDGLDHRANDRNEILNCSPDILIRIGSCLDINDLLKLSLTCRFMNGFVQKELGRRRRALFNGQRQLKA